MTSDGATLTQQIECLAQRVMAGEVAFFVGAGFSLDSEKNSTWRLQVRLLTRFDALTEALEEHGLRARFVDTFGLKKAVAAPKGALLSEAALSKLGAEYYALNDWMCTAFATMLECLRRLDPTDAQAKLERCYARERELLVAPFTDPVPLAPVELDELSSIRDPLSQGKALFLETLGFGSSEIMAGDALNSDLLAVLSSYCQRPRRRHEVLARLAREGLCPTLVTTNYDLLLEGAYRLSGFELRQTPDEQLLAPTLTPRFAVVADPLEFFQLGDGTRSALVLKLHGCARSYRQAKEESLKARRAEKEAPAKPAVELPNGPSRWERYLRAIVYTYREIQNWREDSWSRDFLRTLLRTRTLVLCGYSAADSVVHDTFRTVYEELSRYSRAPLPMAEGARSPAAAPAFFIGPRDNWEFHGVEILRAASQAVGLRFPELTRHANYVQFEFVAPNAFPTMDDVFVWLFHRVLRLRQRQALHSDLRRVVSQLLIRPPRDSEVEKLKARFQELLSAEESLAASLTENGPRQRFASLVDWTDQFHVAFLRQLALAEALTRRQRSRTQIDQLRRIPTWYFPVADRPEWAAWAVVVELALRRMLELQIGGAASWKRLPEAVVVSTLQGAPALSWRAKLAGATTPAGLALTIRWEGDPVSLRRLFPGAPRSRRSWWASRERLPWRREQEPKDKASEDAKDEANQAAPTRPRQVPDARVIWEFALGGGTAEQARDWIEESQL